VRHVAHVLRVKVAMLACAPRVQVAIPGTRCGYGWRSRVRATGAGGDPKNAPWVQVAILAFARRVQVAIQTGTQHRK
jgi:hypothetical protein